MGYNTMVLFLNDGLDQARKNATGVLALVDRHCQSLRHDGMGRDGRRVELPAGNHANAVHLVSCLHADEVALIAAGGNYATLLGSVYMGSAAGHHTEEQQLELLKAILDPMGYHVVRKPEKKP